MLLDELGEVDGGAHLLGGALLSSPRTTRTSGAIADKHLGRARDVVRVPFGTRALQEAKEAGRRAQRVMEGRAGAGEGGSVALVAWAGQGVKEAARGGDPADHGGRVRRGGVDRDLHGFGTIHHIRTDRYVHEEGPMKMLRCLRGVCDRPMQRCKASTLNPAR